MQENEVIETLGHKLRYLRNLCGLSRKDVAKAINVSDMAIGAYERGSRAPSLDKILELADFFHVSVDDLLAHKKKDEPFMDAKLFWHSAGYDVWVGSDHIAIMFPVDDADPTITERGNMKFLVREGKALPVEDKESFIEFTRRVQSECEQQSKDITKRVCKEITEDYYQKYCELHDEKPTNKRFARMDTINQHLDIQPAL